MDRKTVVLLFIAGAIVAVVLDFFIADTSSFIERLGKTVPKSHPVAVTEIPLIKTYPTDSPQDGTLGLDTLKGRMK